MFSLTSEVTGQAKKRTLVLLVEAAVAAAAAERVALCVPLTRIKVMYVR